MLLAMARRQGKMGTAPSQTDLQSSAAPCSTKEESSSGVKGTRTSAEQSPEQAAKLVKKPSGRKLEGAEPQSGLEGSEEQLGEEDSGAQETDLSGEAPSASKDLEVSLEGSSKQLKCPTCGEDFATSKLLNEHIVIVHGTAATKHPCPHPTCNKSFVTSRGLSKHWEYEPQHRLSTIPPQSLPVSTQSPTDPPTSRSEPTSPHKLEASPIQSPPSTPSSPTFRVSSRNPTYPSIIRTRRSSNTEQLPTSVETGAKRLRVAATSPPAKAMLLNTGEKVSVGGDLEREEMAEGTQMKRQQKGGNRSSRTRSLSGSDNQPPPVKASFSSSDLTRSPLTRSNSAAMKAVEFVSLPTRKKRRRTRTGSNKPEEPAEETQKEPKVVKAEPERKTEESVQIQQPVKRRRGRPPKNRKDPPVPTSTSTPSSKVSTPTTGSSDQQTPSSGEAVLIKSSTSSTSSLVSPTEPMDTKSTQQFEENPIPLKAEENVPGGSAMNLPLWESIGDKMSVSDDEKLQQKMGSNLQALLSKSTECKDKGKDLPELPPIQPSILPPSSCPPALSIPSILPKLCSKSESGPETSLIGASNSHSIVTSFSSTPSCSYVITSKESKMTAGFESKPVTSTNRERVAGGATNRDNNSDEPEIIEVKQAKSVEIDLTKDDDEDKVQSKPTRKKSSDNQPGRVTEIEPVNVASKKTSAKEPRPSAQSRSSSVIVSVLAGGENKSSTEREQTKDRLSDEEKQKAEVRSKLPAMESSSYPPASAPTPTPPQMSYPPSSAPTPTYGPSPYSPYSVPYPPPMMFSPGGGPSPFYPPYYGGYPSVTQPHMPGAFIPPGAGMMPPPPMEHPPDVTMPFSTYGTPFTSTPVPIPTTAGGVRVSVLDKPPTHLPTVPPHHVPSAPGRPRSAPNAYMEQGPGGQSSIVRSFVGAGGTSPEGPPPGMDISRGPHPHPLSQAYRSMPGSYLPPSQSPYVSVRMDLNGMPYVDWGPPLTHHHRNGSEGLKGIPMKFETKHSQPEEQTQPVECPECGRSFKNNKALNGHMRLHGGFDWTKKPFTTVQGATNEDSGKSTTNNNGGNNGSSNEEGGSGPDLAKKPKKSSSKKRSRSRSTSPGHGGKRRRTSNAEVLESEPVNLPAPSAPKVFTFDTQKVQQTQTIRSTIPPPPPMQDAGTMTQPHRNATLDDLCRAVEELERMENGRKQKEQKELENQQDEGKRRPGNITIPHSHSSPALEREKVRFGATPPYTPPPILSPARSMTMLANFSGAPSQPCTPSRILTPWTSRRSSDGRLTSESEESFAEPKINVGKDFQAVLPPFNDSISGLAKEDHRAICVWKPIPNLTTEDENTLEGYLELACSPAILHAGRNKEFAMHLLYQVGGSVKVRLAGNSLVPSPPQAFFILQAIKAWEDWVRGYQVGGSVKEAVRLLMAGKSLFTPTNGMTTYNYSGSKRWSSRERQQFRRAWRVQRKQFHVLRNAVESKRFPDIVEYYYSWKKYCSDEYRGRNRHISEEILTDEDDTAYPHLNSTSSSGSAENNDPTPPPPLPDPKKQRKTEKQKLPPPQPSRFPVPPHMGSMYDHLPIVYAPHTALIGPGNPVHQYKCKYPGCNQVFTSIFALNGHIRVHGGSFYPKPEKRYTATSSAAASMPKAPPTHSTTPATATTVKPTFPSSSGTSAVTHAPTSSQQHHGHHLKPIAPSPSLEHRSPHQLELARALLELPQPRSPARSSGYHTPSPKPSPGGSSSGKTKSPKKKMSSASPGEREGYYPCNRCGRVFSKVKSRSAHMKSHIMKQN